MAIFPIFFIRQYRQGKRLLWYSRSSKSRKIDIFPKGLTHGPVLVQKWPVFKVFFLRNVGQEIVFYDILETKNASLGYKNNKFENSRKTEIFPKGLPMVLVQKWPFFQVFLFSNIGQENVFFDILETENAFIGYKNNKLKKVKKLTFFQRG